MWLVGTLHPMPVHFPIGLVVRPRRQGTIAFHTGRPACRTISVVNVRGGPAMGAITVVAGWALHPYREAQFTVVGRTDRTTNKKGGIDA
jgi:uncharacterized membrane protein